jgi:hypothetical protein
MNPRIIGHRVINSSSIGARLFRSRQLQRMQGYESRHARIIVLRRQQEISPDVAQIRPAGHEFTRFVLGKELKQWPEGSLTSSAATHPP